MAVFSILTILPVNNKPHVEALTNTESDFLRCDFQSATLNLSLISASAVSLSGTRINASAKHISKIPSLVSKLYSTNKASIIWTAFLSLRTRLIKSAA